jgi:hypothetical protein
MVIHARDSVDQLESIAHIRSLLAAMVPRALLLPRMPMSAKWVLDYVMEFERVPLARIIEGVRDAVASPDTEALLGSCHPLYWAFMSLIGHYCGASETGILEASTVFMTALVVREMIFDGSGQRLPPSASALRAKIAAAYLACAKDSDSSSCDWIQRFQAKCDPWVVFVHQALLRLRPSNRALFTQAVHSLHATFSMMQVTDDWHDQGEDRMRCHWNLWTDEPYEQASRLSVCLANAAFTRVRRLKRSLLREIMSLQLLATLDTATGIVQNNMTTSKRDSLI